MPEGDTIYRTASALRPLLVGKEVLSAQARPPGPQIYRVVGSTVQGIDTRGKHLIINFSNGLALHTHLMMTGSWHRYAPGERWRKPAFRARVVLEVPGHVVVCFSAPVVELMDERVVKQDPRVDGLGPDLLAPTFDADEAFRRLRSPSRVALTLGEALLDQHALAGIGNIFKSEILFVEKLDPWVRLHDLDDAVLRQVLATSERLLRLNANGKSWGRTTTEGSAVARGASLWVYGRTGRPCFRCGTRIQSAPQGEQHRRTYWCPRCQEGRSAPTD